MVYMQRFKWWAIECVASGVVLASFLSYRYYLDDENAEWTRFDSLFFFTPAISILLSLCGMVASVWERDDPTACRMESVLVWAITILWAVATVFTILGPFRTREVRRTDVRSEQSAVTSPQC